MKKKNVVRIRKNGILQVKFQDPEGHWIGVYKSLYFNPLLSMPRARPLSSAKPLKRPIAE